MKYVAPRIDKALKLCRMWAFSATWVYWVYHCNKPRH